MTGIKRPGIIVQCAVRQIDGVILNQMRNASTKRACMLCALCEDFSFRFSRVWPLASFGADKKPPDFEICGNTLG